MLLTLTVLNLIALGGIAWHALLLKNWQLFPSIMYLLTGDAQAGLAPYSSKISLATSAHHQQMVSISVGANSSTEQANDGEEPASMSLPAAHIFSIILASSQVLGMCWIARFFLWIFFGSIREIEWEHISEWSWMASTECFLAMTIFKDELSQKFILTFFLVMCIKSFHWVARDRVDYMEQTSRLGKWFHLRMIGALTWCLILDSIGLYSTTSYTINKGPSMMLLFANEVPNNAEAH